MPEVKSGKKDHSRCSFIGGSDARIIMGRAAAALLRLWRERRSEVEAPDLSGNLLVQLGRATEDLNRRWFEAHTHQSVTDVQRHCTTPCSAGWAPPSTGEWRVAGRCSR